MSVILMRTALFCKAFCSVSSSLSTLNKILSVILISFKNGMNYQNGRLIVIIEKVNYCSLEDILIATSLCFIPSPQSVVHSRQSVF